MIFLSACDLLKSLMIQNNTSEEQTCWRDFVSTFSGTTIIQGTPVASGSSIIQGTPIASGSSTVIQGTPISGTNIIQGIPIGTGGTGGYYGSSNGLYGSSGTSGMYGTSGLSSGIYGSGSIYGSGGYGQTYGSGSSGVYGGQSGTIIQGVPVGSTIIQGTPIGSTGGLYGTSGSTTYGTSNTGLTGLTQSIFNNAFSANAGAPNMFPSSTVTVAPINPNDPCTNSNGPTGDHRSLTQWKYGLTRLLKKKDLLTGKTTTFTITKMLQHMTMNNNEEILIKICRK